MDNFLYNDIFLRNIDDQNNKESFNNVELQVYRFVWMN